MANTSTVPTSKIVMLLIFLCAAIMTSLFIFRLSHTPAPNNKLAANDGVIFPAPRDIKAFDLVSSDKQKFTQQNFYGHWTLLFFGFTHCSSICPATLDMLNRAYPALHAAYPNLQVVLVSLDPDRDSVEALNKYTHAYNPAFIGVSGKIQNVRRLQSQLGIYSALDNTSTDKNYQLQHTPSILLINPQGKWSGLFAQGLKPEQFIQAFKASV
jgi:protein SCO1/2